jgi:hypothetical protein
MSVQPVRLENDNFNQRCADICVGITRKNSDIIKASRELYKELIIAKIIDAETTYEDVVDDGALMDVLGWHLAYGLSQNPKESDYGMLYYYLRRIPVKVQVVKILTIYNDALRLKFPRWITASHSKANSFHNLITIY